jgi:hypothetical protein
MWQRFWRAVASWLKSLVANSEQEIRMAERGGCPPGG